jgi:hypothetical protein
MFMRPLAMVVVLLASRTVWAANATPSVSLLAPAGVEQGQVASVRYKVRVQCLPTRHGADV